MRSKTFGAARAMACGSALGLLSMVFGCNGKTFASGESSVASDGGQSGQSQGPPSATCSWPAYLDDAGPGACAVGRAFVECQYPEGVVCEGGTAASGEATGPSGTVLGINQACISNDPTSCQGCTSTRGVATCANKCAPNEYALSCGGLPALPLPDGGDTERTYQQPPDDCMSVGITPAGITFYCCPCQ